MQAGKAEKQPPPTQLVTLLMQTPQLYACNAVRTSVNVAVDEAGCTIAVLCQLPGCSFMLAGIISNDYDGIIKQHGICVLFSVRRVFSSSLVTVIVALHSRCNSVCH
jgi:hypothetical protein